jgi:hypothetical protein
MSKADIVKANYYLTRAADLPALGVVRCRRWAKSKRSPQRGRRDGDARRGRSSRRRSVHRF